jgi:hypothetical protein
MGKTLFGHALVENFQQFQIFSTNSENGGSTESKGAFTMAKCTAKNPSKNASDSDNVCTCLG